MRKRQLLWAWLVLVLSLAVAGPAQTADPGLIGWWKLENEGDAAVLDYSGNGHGGTIQGSPEFVPGVYGQALEFHGDPDYVSIDGYKGLLGGAAFTVTAWIKTEGNGGIVGWGNNAATERVEFRVNEYRLRVEHGSGNRQGNTVVSDNEWHHVALAVQENATISYPDVILYLDGQDDTTTGTSSNAFNIVSNFDLTIARQYSGSNRWFIGLIDDVRLYDRALSAEEIGQLAALPWAHGPSPADGSVHSSTWASLSWSAAADAVSHDVYFGDNLQDVTAGTAGTFQGSQTTIGFLVGFSGFPIPQGLTPGATYYWRIDEKHADGTLYKGSVWSFSVPPLKASRPNPPSAATFITTDVTLGWQPGYGAKLHHVYFGESAADVAAGTADTYKGIPSGTTYTPGSLASDRRYYWRIDGFDGIQTRKGDVWSFRTRPVTAIYDPHLVAWWKLDDDGSVLVVDSSGYGHHGTLHGDPQYVPGYEGEALELDGSGDFVLMDGYKGILDTNPFTIAAWIRTGNNGQVVGWGNTGTGQKVEFWINGGRLRCDTNGGNVQGDTNVIDDEWHHAAVTVKQGATISSGDVTIYLDGQDDTRASTDTDAFNISANFDVKIGQMYDFSSSRWFVGFIDDLRIYDKVLTPEEIQKAMLGDPRLAREPHPEDGSTPNILAAKPLGWTAGEGAVSHDVYFGMDEQAVRGSDALDTTGAYRGRQDANSYTPPDVLDYDQAYYWRIDEVQAGGVAVHRGRIWSFTTADYIVLDDFERYSDFPPDEIFSTWTDGFFDPANGSTVGYPDPDFAAGEHYVETAIVHGGAQSMPYFYDNSVGNSEAAVTLSSQRDWTAQGVKALSLWFRGYPESVGGFTEGPAGTYTMTARGADIWGTSDEFHFAFKELSGTGAIVAKVENVRNTNDWAKAGVMIRDTLDPGSTHGMMVVSPAQGIAFQRRTEAGNTSDGTTLAGITAPQWVKIERDLGGSITASYSSDNVTWTQIGSQVIAMNPPIYIGLVLTSHDASMTGEAAFSSVQITGAVSPQWTHQDIGILSNAAEPLYVALANKNGTAGLAYHNDADAARTGDWTEWNIDLKEFADQGVNLADVNSFAIGLGNRQSPQPGGSGKMYFDDIRLYRPRCIPLLRKSVADFNNDCVVNYVDLELMAADWLRSDSTSATAAPNPAFLTAHYKLDGNATDSSGKNNHGAERGNPTYGPGTFDRAIHLDGVDDYIAIGKMQYADAGHTEVSVCAWVRTSSTADQHIASFDRNEYWRLQIAGEAGGPGLVGWSVMTSSGQVDHGSARRVDDGQWHHVAGVFDNGTLTIYIDGGPESSLYGGSTFGTGTIRFGFLGIGSEATEFNGRSNATGYFDGDLDDVRIYSHALSAAEIRYLADATPQDGQLYVPVASLANIHDQEGPGSRIVNFNDFAVLMADWLDEQLWPAP